MRTSVVARRIAVPAVILIAAIAVCIRSAPALASAASHGQFIELLETAKRSEALYFAHKGKDPEIDQQGRLMDAIDSYTELYQLYRWPQALARVAELRKEPLPVLEHASNASLGRIKVDVSRMELKNPVYDSYTMYLCHIEDRSPLWVHAKSPTLTLHLKGGASLSPEVISATHPLYKHLWRLAGTFVLPAELAPGRVASYKVVFAQPSIMESDVLSFELDGYDLDPIILPFLENLFSRRNDAGAGR